MKKQYPSYKLVRIRDLQKKAGEKDRKILNDFLEYVSISAGEKKIAMTRRQMLQFYDITGVSYDKITLDIVRKFLTLLNRSDRAIETQNDIKKTIKRFLKWYYKDWSERFDDLKDIKTRDGTNHQRLNASTILTLDELSMIVNSIDSLKYKALILLMFESAGRPEEILKLRWKDINFDKKEVSLYSAKTKRSRVNPIHESVEHLRRYRGECFYPSVRSEDYVFPSPVNKNKHLVGATLNETFRKIEKTLKLKKHIFPYLLRHTRLTNVHKKLSPKAYEKFAGHSIEVGTKRYAHLDNDDVREEMLEKVYHIENITSKDNKRIKELESRLKKLESTIHEIIDKANLVYDIKMVAQ